MTDRQRYFCLSEIPSYTDKDAYISDLCLSSMWGDDEESDIPAERITALSRLWDAWHRSMKDICAAAGLTQWALAERFAIPLRTVENWCSGSRTPPDYTRLMIQELLGLL